MFKCPRCKGTGSASCGYADTPKEDRWEEDCFDCEGAGTLLAFIRKQWDCRWKYRAAEKWGAVVRFLTNSPKTIIVWKKGEKGPDISKHEDIRRYSIGKKFLTIVDKYGEKKLINIDTPDLLHIYFQK